MAIDLNLILLIIVVVTCMWLMLRVSRPLRAEASKLTVDQARTFHQKYRNKANRADMPPEFRAVAEASDRARPVTIAACAASAASIAAYIFIGG
ncbi:hypothetical protein A8B78_08745 [Jannaschia sp. EhC01]|nr:hypothetical protein A8B78_08745 [Jannaschia sp. EhC01]